MPKTNDRRANRIKHLSQSEVTQELEKLGKYLIRYKPDKLRFIGAVGYAHGYLKDPILSPRILESQELVALVTVKANAYYKANFLSDTHFHSSDVIVILASLSVILTESVDKAIELGQKGGDSNRKNQVSRSK